MRSRSTAARREHTVSFRAESWKSRHSRQTLQLDDAAGDGNTQRLSAVKRGTRLDFSKADSQAPKSLAGLTDHRKKAGAFRQKPRCLRGHRDGPWPL